MQDVTKGLPFVFRGVLHGKPCNVLFDTGSEFSLISSAYVQTTELISYASTPLVVVGFDLTQVNSNTVVNADLAFRHINAPVQLRPVSSLIPGVDIILGVDMLSIFGT